jgi:hypothetical protein
VGIAGAGYRRDIFTKALDTFEGKSHPAISLVGLGGATPAGGGATATAARDVIRPGPRLVRVSPDYR